MYIGIDIRYPLFIFDFVLNRNVSSHFIRSIKYEIFTKILPSEVVVIHVDGRTDRHNEADSRFPHVNAPEI